MTEMVQLGTVISRKDEERMVGAAFGTTDPNLLGRYLTKTLPAVLRYEEPRLILEAMARLFEGGRRLSVETVCAHFDPEILADIGGEEYVSRIAANGHPPEWVGYYVRGGRSATSGPDSEQTASWNRHVEPVDLLGLMSAEPPEEEWCIEPILPARKHTGLVAFRGNGKSLLALDLAARKATGQVALNQPAGQATHVVYLDQEMGPDDLYERLADLGWTTENSDFGKLVKHLHYYQLIDLPPLDTEEGGQALEAIVERHQAELVVVDTVSRVTSGKEDSSDTFKELFRHTETRLKRRGVTLLRLDHLGKDKSRGSRGSSGKEDALDVVWQLTETRAGSLSLKLTKGRQAWIPQALTIARVDSDGTLCHVITDEPDPAWLVGLVEQIDDLRLPEDAGTPTVQKALRAAGQGRRRADIAKAVRFRKERANAET